MCFRVAWRLPSRNDPAWRHWLFVMAFVRCHSGNDAHLGVEPRLFECFSEQRSTRAHAVSSPAPQPCLYTGSTPPKHKSVASREAVAATSGLFSGRGVEVAGVSRVGGPLDRAVCCSIPGPLRSLPCGWPLGPLRSRALCLLGSGRCMGSSSCHARDLELLHDAHLSGDVRHGSRAM